MPRTILIAVFILIICGYNNTVMQVSLNAAAVFDKSAGLYRLHGTPECLQLAYDAAVVFVPELAKAPREHSFQRQRVVNVASDIYLAMEARYA